MSNNKTSELLPDSLLFSSKNRDTSNLFRTLSALNIEQNERISPLIDSFVEQYSPFTTVEFIDQWERTVGIPDSCFTNVGLSIDQRRNQVLIKLISRGANTLEDYAAILELFGITNFNIVNGLANGVFPLIFPIKFYTSRKEAAFSITFQFPEEDKPGIVFPLDFPAPFGSSGSSRIECYLRKIVPAVYSLTFEYIL